jgi:hypothetical protein
LQEIASFIGRAARRRAATAGIAPEMAPRNGISAPPREFLLVVGKSVR